MDLGETTSARRQAQSQREIEPQIETKELTLDLIASNTMQQVSLEHISPKYLNDLDRSVQELLVIMRKAKLRDEPLQESLRLLEQKLGEARRERFDEANPEYQGY